MIMFTLVFTQYMYNLCVLLGLQKNHNEIYLMSTLDDI